jgi:hypothetical protein
VPSFLTALRRARPDLVYVIDWGYPAVVAALMHGATTRTPVVVDIGDPLGPGWLAPRWAYRAYSCSVV